MAHAIGRAAIQQRYQVLYRETHVLLDELAEAIVDGTRCEYMEDWGRLLSDVAAVSAMLDRLLHHGHVLPCGPRSWRTKTAAPTAEGKEKGE